MERGEILAKARYLMAMTNEGDADRLIKSVLTMVDDGPVPMLKLDGLHDRNSKSDT